MCSEQEQSITRHGEKIPTRSPIFCPFVRLCVASFLYSQIIHFCLNPGEAGEKYITTDVTVQYMQDTGTGTRNYKKKYPAGYIFFSKILKNTSSTDMRIS
jgi:hypothetical protein